MTTSQRYQSSRAAVGHSDVEFQTPAVSEKFQSRFGWRLPKAERAETGPGVTISDSSEELCSSGSSASFQPIRSQIPIPTAHVMPSTAGAPPRARDHPHRTPPTSSSLSKSASSPNLDTQTGPADGIGTTSGAGFKQDCLSRYRSMVNGLDCSLFPGADDAQRFETPALEPTLNQSVLLAGLGPSSVSGSGPDVRMQLRMSSLGDGDGDGADAYRTAFDQTYRVLPEARPAPPGSCDPYGAKRGIHVGSGAPVDAEPQEPGAGWQQHKHRLENLRMQVEQMQLMSGVYPAVYPSPLQAESSQWEAVVKANEALLKDKELIIERQSQQLCQLEKRLRESELQIHGALMGRGAAFPDLCLLRLQEAQRENSFLRAQFAERSDSLAQEKLEAERRLGAVEAETRRLSESLKESVEKHAEELKKQEERIRNRDKHITNLKKKCQKEAEQSREKQQRIETLERYLADLPSMDEYQNQRKQLEEAERKADELRAEVLELERRLEEERSSTRSKDGQLEEQRRRERELLATVTSLQARVQESLEDGVRLPSLDIEKLREENKALKEEQQRLKKVIEKQLRMMEQLGSQIRSVEQHLCEEESNNQALREELNSKEEQLLQLRTAVKELSVQNQELMEQSVSVREQLQAVEEAGLSVEGVEWAESAGVTRRLHGEMAACLRDLHSLCSVLTQRAHGQDPNLSLLLGISSSPVVQECEDWSDAAVVQRKLEEALQLRRDVEALRTAVSDRYAQDMGDNCTTQ